MWTNEGVRKVFVDGTNEASPEKVRKDALLGLANLASAAENKVPMWTNEGVRRVFVDGANEASPEKVREYALRGLGNLTRAAENKFWAHFKPILDSLGAPRATQHRNGNVTTFEENPRTSKKRRR
jgi:hypothetical protein